MTRFQCDVKGMLVGAAVWCSVFAIPVFAQPGAAPAAADKDILPTTTAAEVSRAVGGPTLVSLHFKDVPLRTVVDEMAKQAGIKLPTFPSFVWQQQLPAKVTIDIDRQPYWLAVRELSKSSKSALQMSQWENKPFWSMMQGDQIDGPQVSQDLFLIVANSMRRDLSYSVRFGSQPATEDTKSLQFSASAFADPKLRLIGYSMWMEVEKAVDEKGNSLKSKHASDPSYSMQSASAQTFVAGLTLPPNHGKRLATIKGYIRLLQAKKIVTWEIRNILNSQKLEKTITNDIGTTRYVLNDVRKAGDSYTVDITATTTPKEKPSPNQGFSSHPLQFGSISSAFMRLFDYEGKEFQLGGGGMRGDGNETNVTAGFSYNSFGEKTTIGEASKLVIEFPTELVELRVPFEFTDLPIP